MALDSKVTATLQQEECDHESRRKECSSGYMRPGSQPAVQ